MKKFTLLVPDEFSTIQEAINASDDGYTIKVSPGNYEEILVIENIDNLSIIGEQSIINQIQIGSVFSFKNCKKFKVTGFKIIGSDKIPPAIGINVLNSSGEISNCVINGFWHGIYAMNTPKISNDLTVNKCILNEFEKYGVVTWKGVNSTISGNNFLKSSAIPEIGVTACISVWGGTSDIKHNLLNNQDVGITINDDAYIENNELISVDAINCTVKNNEFENQNIGIRLTKIFSGQVLNTLIVNNSFVNVVRNYLIGVDENEVHITPN